MSLARGMFWFPGCVYIRSIDTGDGYEKDVIEMARRQHRIAGNELRRGDAVQEQAIPVHAATCAAAA
jgi:hypothetical protein